MTDKLKTIQLQFQVRNARKRGPTSSDQINDTNAELAADLAELNSQWNDQLVPLTTSLPNGVPDTDIDAFLNGLDGANLYVEQNATASVNSLYFNTPNARPNSVFEQFADVYSSITAVTTSLENLINNTSVAALQVSITDSSSLYAASNVEDALSEVMTNLNTLNGAAENGAADSLNTTTNPVDVSASAAPSAGQILKATAATTATWQADDKPVASTVTPAGTTQTLDLSTSESFIIDLGSASGDVTVTLSNPVSGVTYIIKIIQGATARDITWPGTVKWDSDGVQIISTTDDDEDVIGLWYDGTSFFALIAQDFS